MDQAAFEEYIADDVEEHRGELHVEQVTPRYGVARGAYLRILEIEPFEAVYDELSERVQQFLKVATSEQLDKERGDSGDVVEEAERTARYLRICHDSDRTYAGYSNIYRALKALAPFLESGRFVIKEDYATWVDAYRVADGELGFERGRAENDYIDAFHDYVEAKAISETEDTAWVYFAAWLLSDWARYLIDCVEREAKGREARSNQREADALLARAASLHPEHPSVFVQRARLCQVLGRHEEANAWFDKRRAIGRDASTTFEAVMNALASGADGRAAELLKELTTLEPERRAAHQLLGMLAAGQKDADSARSHVERAIALGDAARLNPDKEAIHRSGRLGEMIDTYVRHALEVVDIAQRERLAADVLEWAELYRIKMCHGIRKKQSRERAADLYERTLRISTLAGDVHQKKALFLRQARRKGSRAALDEALAINPRHLETLGDLGKEAFEAERWDEAIERLTLYIEVSHAEGASSYYRQAYAAMLVGALVQRGYALLGEDQYQPADEHFERAIGLGPELSWSQQKYVGAWVGRSDAHTYLLRHDEALAFADHALTLDDGSVHAWSARGSSLNNLGRYEEAMDCYERAMAIDDSYFHPYYCKACTLTLTGGDRAEIFALLRKASKREPSCRRRMKTEPDLEALRGDRKFQRIVGAG